MTWSTVPITKVARVVGGATPKTDNPDFWDGTIDWATPKDLSDLDGKMISSTPRKITDAGLKGCAAEVLPAGSVLFSSRAPIGHIAINSVPMATNQGFKSFVPGPELDASFLYWWLDANRAPLQAMGTGATFKEVSKAVVERIEIPVPPLEEQRRIAGILDQADALRHLRTRALDRLNTLGQAIFHEMFGDLRTNELGWQEGVTLGELADVVSGITKGRKVKTENLREVPYLAVSNVQDRFLKLEVVKTIEATEDEIARYRLRRDDVLLTEGGDPDKLGRGTLWKEQLPECIHQNHVFRVRVFDDRARPTFLSWQLGSERGKQYFLRSAKQTTGIASINKTQINAFPLVLPPVTLQKKFEEQLSDLDVRMNAYGAASAQSEALFTSLQHRAFRGEL
ncbi:type I restriction enzyme, S subunit [Gemmobacter megaterium]|uniref:Type I restriction enzyme, S subunit n=1 Tax=Gemmobacter megaterium TaxID=1086013 RepID=A0A1N7QPP2_9RHOB|nr:restriction endonuclease subunit S [Gemmobacter megaterium]GGE28475.1 hypothetical protein GCM10011345_38180 [Gemmobacter megaterium]SIT24872.1 type I restriction enzyme, S subunit [Gemmobacter megaterium]